MAFIYDLVDAWNAGGTSFNAIRMNVTDTASAAASRLISLQINGSERFSVRKDGQGYFAGNVGIGTTSPAQRLHVNGNALLGGSPAAQWGGITLATDVAIQQAAPVLNFVNAAGSTRFGYIFHSGAGGNVEFLNQQAGAMLLGTNNAERMRIEATGNIGIGTSAPGSTLDVAGTIRTSASGSDPGTGSVFYFVGSGNFQSVIAGAAFAVHTGNNNARIERMRIDISGNVLVGTSATEGPSRMSVVSTASTTACISYRNTAGAGSTYAYFLNGGNTAQIGSITNSGNTGTAYNTSSDARLKHDIVEAPEASDLIDAIKVRSFKWNVDNSEQRYGFVAQELVEVAPEAVHQPEDEDQMMAVDYSKLVPMLVKEIQSLRARVAQLEGN